MKKLLLSLLAAAFCGPAFANLSEPGAAPLVTLKDGDTWVMVGDSITAGRLHSNFVEAFFRTRYPHLRLHFRNAGVNGAAAQSFEPFFPVEIAPWKPTIVSVAYGMNDSNRPDPAFHIEKMTRNAEMIRGIGARPLFIGSSPVNDGSTMALLAGKNKNIHAFTEALQELGRKLGIPVVDQFHPLVDLWARGKPGEVGTAFVKQVGTLHFEDEANVPDLETLRSMAAQWKGSPDRPMVTSLNDTIHPGPYGQYMMAATILKALNVDREVSSATIDAKAQKLVAARLCSITDVAYADGKLSFKRLDERLPWPNIGKDTAEVAKVIPDLADLSRYLLTVTGLPKGSYTVRMNGEVVATLTDKELAAGWNMSLLTAGPVFKRLHAVNAQIGAIQGKPNMDWREASKAKDAAKMAAAQQQIDELEEKLQAFLQPVEIAFEIAPAPAEPAK